MYPLFSSTEFPDTSLNSSVATDGLNDPPELPLPSNLICSEEEDDDDEY